MKENIESGSCIWFALGVLLTFVMAMLIFSANKNREFEKNKELENKLEIVNYLQDRNNELYQDNYNMHSLLDSMKQ